MGYKLFSLGSLFLNDTVQQIPLNPKAKGDIPSYSGVAPIRIGNTVPGKAIPWIQPDGMNILVAQKVLLVDVSWDQLNMYGLVNGKEILIDGNRYTCRLLQLGAAPKENSEWAQILRCTGRGNKIWNWSEVYSWGQDEQPNAEAHPACGFAASNQWSCFTAGTRMKSLGYRPVLEPRPATMFKDLYTTILDGQKFCVMQAPGYALKDFLPQLHPVKEENRSHDFQVFGSIEDGCFLKMYTLLMDGEPVQQNAKNPVQYKSGAQLEITDRYFGDKFLITWSINNGVAHAVKPVLRNITANVLREQGFRHSWHKP